MRTTYYDHRKPPEHKHKIVEDPPTYLGWDLRNGVACKRWQHQVPEMLSSQLGRQRIQCWSLNLRSFMLTVDLSFLPFLIAIRERIGLVLQKVESPAIRLPNREML